jgi:AcrR family transcriptional regulator
VTSQPAGPRTGRRTGRRPGDSGARQAIVAAARSAFGDRGYDGTSIRAIARDAGVDPALVHHYFGTKADLFDAAAVLPIEPQLIVSALTSGRDDRVGERVVRLFLSVWESAEGRAAFFSLLRSAVSNVEAAAALGRLVTRDVLEPVARAMDRPNAPLRAALAASHMIGLAMARYVVRVEPLAGAPPDELVRAVAPAIQRYLTGDLA